MSFFRRLLSENWMYAGLCSYIMGGGTTISPCVLNIPLIGDTFDLLL